MLAGEGHGTGAGTGGRMVARLVQAKLAAPDLDDRLVPRPRLDADIAHLLDRHPVLVVAAVAGAGKTVAVAQALRARGRPVAWVRLDTSDRAAGRLVVYLEAAIARHHPAVAGRASAALRDGAPTTDAAALLVEDLAGSGLVVVCDNVERVGTSRPAMAVLSAVARYLPAGTNLVLVSRHPVALTSMATHELGRTGVLDAELLRFRAGEARTALARRGLEGVDVDAAMGSTGGWVTGVLFATGGPAGDGRALAAYLYEHVWGDLGADEQDLLLRTAVLEDLTAGDAAALGAAEPARTLERLRARHLPLTWTVDGRGAALHTQFREFVLGLAAGRDAAWRGEVRHRHVALLASRGRTEDVVEALLDAGEVDEAWGHAVEALPLVVERMDLAQAARWLDALGAVHRPPVLAVSTAALRVAFGLEEYRRGAALWDAHGERWVAELVDADAPEPVVLLVWCLWHLGRLTEARRVAAALPDGGWHRRVAATVLALSVDDPPPFPELGAPRGGPLEGLLLRVAYSRGRLDLLRDPQDPSGSWREVQGAPWRIAALRAAGRADEALAEWELRRGTPQPLWLDALDGVELLLDAGRADEARGALARGHERARASGSAIYRVLLLVYEARAHLRTGDDLEPARRTLARAQAEGADDHAFTRDLAGLCHGVVLLREGRAEAAEATLARCMEGMRRGDRWLELPAAACLLAEAQARRVDREADADASAALALRVAEERGTTALLLAALAEVPGVARRAAAAGTPEASRWAALARRVGAATDATDDPAGPRVVLEEFGVPELLVDGRPVALRRRRELELLAHLLDRPGRSARREELLDALFPGRDDRGAASYLRQCVHRLRAVLPDGVDLDRDGERLRIVPPDAVAGTCGQALATLRRARARGGEERRALLADALRAADRGPFLDGTSGPWVDERRREVADRIAAGRLELATLAADDGDLGEAERQVGRVLADDPYREQAWRVRLVVDGAAGDHDRLVEHYRAYVAVMRELDMGPSAEMHRLVETIRGVTRPAAPPRAPTGPARSAR
ncbi:winged helix-turn-helix domain-containing protein [Actinomycetospora sp. CA-101289]|uniref:winged helix-turn-helix domain-containing protein n=1 Tax=Actinomycetospora sp. CA-101289 TaxID=3239893 RepID=UPI003D956D75